MDYIVLDFETTGACRGNENLPWQLGVVRMSHRRIVPEHSFSVYLHVSAEHRFNPYAPGRWAQLRETLEASNTLIDYWPDLQTWLTGHVLVAHHVPTERSILSKSFPLHPFGPWIDTLELSRRAYPRERSHHLEDLAVSLGFRKRVESYCSGLAPHDALYDAFAAAVFLEELLKQPGWRDVQDEDLFLRS